MSGKSCCIKLDDDWEGYSLNHFCIPKHYQPYLKNVLIPHGMVLDRIERLAFDIMQDMGITEAPLSAKPLICICVLKGGYKFFSDIIDSIMSLNRHTNVTLPVRVEFIRAKSYINDKSSRDLKVLGGEQLSDINGKNVLIVEDIVDTGNTMQALLKYLSEYKPALIKVASLFVKRNPKNTKSYRPDYVGFEVPDNFIVGYALDFNEYFRDLGHVCEMSEEGITNFRS